MNHQTTEISSPVLKTIAAWGSVGLSQAVASVAIFLGINTWGDAAQFAAFVLTACYLGEWWWKRMWRPLLVRLGILKPRTHPVIQAGEA